MSTQSMYRLSGIVILIAALVFAVAGTAVATQPFESLLPPLGYFVGLVLAVPVLTAIYIIQMHRAGKLGLAGYSLSVIGAILYSAPNYALMAGTQGVSAWHGIWEFAMGNVLPLGASAFLLGIIALGIATARTGIFGRWSGVLLAGGGLLWMIAFWTGITIVLAAGSLAISFGFVMIGSALAFRQPVDVVTQLNPMTN